MSNVVVFTTIALWYTCILKLLSKLARILQSTHKVWWLIKGNSSYRNKKLFDTCPPAQPTTDIPNLMVRSFHVYIVGTRWDPVLITARLVRTTLDSWNSSCHDIHDQESRDTEITRLSRELEQTTQKLRLNRPTHGFCISTTHAHVTTWKSTIT